MGGGSPCSEGGGVLEDEGGSASEDAAFCSRFVSELTIKLATAGALATLGALGALGPTAFWRGIASVCKHEHASESDPGHWAKCF